MAPNTGQLSSYLNGCFLVIGFYKACLHPGTDLYMQSFSHKRAVLTCFQLQKSHWDSYFLPLHRLYIYAETVIEET